MTTVLLATASVHTTAAACDHLAPRLGPDDTVVVLTVREPVIAERDGGDARNVARTRLVEPSIETLVREADPAEAIREVSTEWVVDEIVIGATRGDPAAAAEPPGSTVRSVLQSIERPVTVLPTARR